jgi:hypothetical protein
MGAAIAPGTLARDVCRLEGGQKEIKSLPKASRRLQLGCITHEEKVADSVRWYPRGRLALFYPNWMI